jgi:sugar phosphate isomerase/epimerase
MARIGLLSPEFPRTSLTENLEAMAALGAGATQFDLVCAVGATFPQELDHDTIAAIKNGLAARGLALAALSGTCNMIHPDPVARARGLADLKRLVAMAPTLGASVVTLCTGSRNPESMWRRHPDNDLPEAWADLLASLAEVLPVAEDHGVVLGVEPEIANVVDSPKKARRLMDELASPQLKVIMDGANIFHRGELSHMRDILDEAFELVGAEIVLAHAKDLDRDGEAGHLPAGRGRLDYPYYLGLLRQSGYDGALILHGLKPGDAPAAIDFVRNAAPPDYLG